MPESQIEFEVKAPIESVWSLMADPEMSTHCIPGLLECEVTGPNTNLWIMEFQIGPLIKRVEMNSTTIEVDPPYRGKWEGNAKGIKMSGEIELKENTNSSTIVFYKLRLEPQSLFLLSMISFIEQKLDNDVRQYAKNIKYHVEKDN
ncbi:MAG: SRPBCC family protein [ANME-2 cluster archaeon]|nr:SRPBCC family protein [ANME-2 cluster archaeon]MDF1530761.1 SRPBCC family protein [ANME-2 cluster archaeon]